MFHALAIRGLKSKFVLGFCRPLMFIESKSYPYYFQRLINMPIAYLTRKEKISCSHRLHSERLNEEENKSVYGKCNNFWGHGHNYTVEVTVRGPVDPIVGMVMNISDLKIYMGNVLEQMDHKNLDKDVDYFKNIVSTTENVAIYIFEEIKKQMPKPELLYEIKVHETDKNTVFYRGE